MKRRASAASTAFRVPLALLAAAVFVPALVGCGGQSAQPVASAPPSATAAPAPVETSPPPVETGSPTATPDDEYDLGAEGGCDPRQLELLIRSAPQSSGAGTMGVGLTYRNISEVGCRMEGNPHIVALTAGDRQPVGAEAEPMYDSGAGSLPLAPGAEVYSLLTISAAGAQDCATATADAILLTTPHRDESTAVTLPLPKPVEICTDGTVLLRAGEIRADEPL